MREKTVKCIQHWEEPDCSVRTLNGFLPRSGQDWIYREPEILKDSSIRVSQISDWGRESLW